MLQEPSCRAEGDVEFREGESIEMSERGHGEGRMKRRTRRVREDRSRCPRLVILIVTVLAVALASSLFLYWQFFSKRSAQFSKSQNWTKKFFQRQYHLRHTLITVIAVFSVYSLLAYTHLFFTNSTCTPYLAYTWNIITTCDNYAYLQ